MTWFMLEDALSKTLAAELSTSSEFMRYILENKIHGVHYEHVDVVGSSKARSTQILDAGSGPRLVDGASEDYIIPGYQLNSDEWGSYNVVCKVLREQGASGNVSSMGEEAYVGDQPKVVIGGTFHSKSLDYLENNGPFLMKNLNDVEKNCSMLLSIADNLEVLPPPDDPLPWDILNMVEWKASLCELIKEMKTVEEKCSRSLICDPGVYVLTTSPYSAFLRALAGEIADAAERIELGP